MTSSERHARNDAFHLLRMAKDKLYEANMQNEMQATDNIMSSIRRIARIESNEHIEDAIK